MKKTLSMIAAATLLAQPALADGIGTPEPEAPVERAQSFTPSSPDWTGFYAGGQIGYADSETDFAGVGNDDIIGGLIIGYDHDFGNTVLGIGFDYDFTDIEAAPGVEVENIFRAKVRGGYKIGNGLAYLTAGYANADTDNLGSDDGYFIGLGYEYLVSDQFSIGGELLYHEFNNFDDTDADVEATTVQIRAAFRF